MVEHTEKGAFIQVLSEPPTRKRNLPYNIFSDHPILPPHNSDTLYTMGKIIQITKRVVRRNNYRAPNV
jgi:hypothetical protein